MHLTENIARQALRAKVASRAVADLFRRLAARVRSDRGAIEKAAEGQSFFI